MWNTARRFGRGIRCGPAATGRAALFCARGGALNYRLSALERGHATSSAKFASGGLPPKDWNRSDSSSGALWADPRNARGLWTLRAESPDGCRPHRSQCDLVGLVASRVKVSRPGALASGKHLFAERYQIPFRFFGEEAQIGERREKRLGPDTDGDPRRTRLLTQPTAFSPVARPKGSGTIYTHEIELD
jgi:hypothetical protein